MPSAEYQRAWRAARGAATGRVGRPVTAPHGTVAAYKRHRRHSEAACEACLAAWAEYQRDRYKARGGDPTAS